MAHLPYLIFFFIIGACVGSFLNVVVWRLPRGESLVTPPSHCPKCNTRLSWRDNIPVFGWIFLRGKCRYCKASISARYPTIEAITGGLFVLYYVMFFMVGGVNGCGKMVIVPPLVPAIGRITILRPFNISDDWAIYALDMFLISGLLAASLIDAELFIIPLEIPWLMAVVAIPFHAVFDDPRMPYSVNLVSPASNALAAGGALGLILSMILWWRKVLPTSFPQGEPMLEVDREELVKEIAKAKREGRELSEEEIAVPPSYSTGQIRAEMRKEMLFLMPPMLLGAAWVLATQHIAPLRHFWEVAVHRHWMTALLGSVLGALIGGFVVWITRILGTLGFGRVAMGLGDVHLMFGVGAIIGAGAATVAFFIAPFFGILIAIYMLFTGTRRELPYGPYLSLATGAVLLFYCPIANYLGPGLQNMGQALSGLMGR